MEQKNGLRILILEDEPTDAALVEHELRRAGLEFTALTVGRRAPFIRALTEFVPDLVLVDYKLPDFDGLSAVKAVRQVSADLPVILVTGALKDEAALEVIKAGANDYVLKDVLIRLPFVVRRTMLQAAESRARRRAERALRTLSAGNEALVHATDAAELLSDMCCAVVQHGGYRMAWIGVAEHDAAKTVRLAASAGPDPGDLERAGVTWADTPLGRGQTGAAIRTGDVQVMQDIADNPAAAPWRKVALKYGFGSGIALPLRDRSGVFGALSIYAAEPDAFDAEEQRLLTDLAEDLSYGVTAFRDRLERDAGLKRLQRSMEATVEAVASTVELRDPYTAGHQRRVAKLAAAIARELQLPEEQVRGIYLAGIIHDVGKIHIPAEILTKPGTLSPMERRLIQTHPLAGHDIVKAVDFPWPIAQTILQHHERLDGSGYPNAVTGKNIIPEARILAVADVVEAMMSHRPYRPALGLELALAEIEKEKGRLYDPAAVEACLRLLREKGIAFA
jgi:response regulator RpfG family c-di-GMP phosphodiesterase